MLEDHRARNPFSPWTYIWSNISKVKTEEANFGEEVGYLAGTNVKLLNDFVLSCVKESLPSVSGYNEAE